MMIRQPENTNIQEAADCRTENEYENISKNSRQHGFVPIQAYLLRIMGIGKQNCRTSLVSPGGSAAISRYKTKDLGQ